VQKGHSALCNGVWPTDAQPAASNTASRAKPTKGERHIFGNDDAIVLNGIIISKPTSVF
jgi:hypothetical protein